MKTAAFAAIAVVSAGCASIRSANNYGGVAVEGEDGVVETVEIENSGWKLFKSIPIGCGDPSAPNRNTCCLFRNTVTLQSNMDMLAREMERTGATRVANLASRKTDETVFFILLTRAAYHTSAVLFK